MAPRSAGERPPGITPTPDVVRELNERSMKKKKRPRRGVPATDPAIVVETLRTNFRNMGRARADDSEAGPARYQMFAGWAALTAFPALAAARQETIEAAAQIVREAWHAALMIRIVAGPWPSPRDDNSIGRPLPTLYGEAQSAEAAGAARVTSVADSLEMPPKPPGKRGRKEVAGETHYLVAGAVAHCVSQGYYATRFSDSRTVHCGFSLVAEALVPAKVWEGYDANRRARAEKSVKDAWHAYWRSVRRVSAEHVRAAELAQRASGAGRGDEWPEGSP